MLDIFMSLPKNLSAHGPLVDHMMVALHWFMLLLFVGWSAFFVYCLIRFRKGRNPKADYHGVRNHFSTHLEFGVILVETFLLIGFAMPFWGKRVNASFPNPGEATTVRVIGQQFLWNFHYPGKDQLFSKQDPKFVSADNQYGLDPNDPNGKDDFFTTGVVRVPVNKPVILRLSSKDVIHNFAIHTMRIAQDAIPGSEIPMWFTPVEVGESTVVCGQLCGRSHYAMQGTLAVDSAEDYAKWADAKSEDAKAKAKK